MNNNSRYKESLQQKYSNYSISKVLKRIFKYALKQKYLIILSFIFLIIFSYLELLQPKLINDILDNHLLGVQTTYVESDKGISYKGKNYVKSDEVDESVISLVYYENSYYVCYGDIDNSIIERISDNTLYTIDNNYVCYKLDNNELKLFYFNESSAIVRLLIYYGLLTIVILLFSYLSNVVMTLIGNKLSLHIRQDAFKKINRLPLDYFTKEPSGKIVTKIINDIDGAESLFTVITDIIKSIISLVMVYIALFRISVKLSLLTFIFFPFVILWMTIYRKFINKYYHRIREMNSIINANMSQYVNGMSVIQEFNKEDTMYKEYDDLLDTNYHNKMKSSAISSTFGGQLLLFVQNILVSIVIYYFSLQFLNKTSELTAGLIYLYINYIGKVMAPIESIFSDLNTLEDSYVASCRIFDLLDEEEDKYLGFNERPNLDGDIKFDHITFKYDTVQVLNDVTLDVKGGSFIGIVGKTGSGKSTLMNLLLRFYDIENGNIYINGKDFMDYTKQEVRSNIGYVLQEPAIFSGTIKSNIVLDKEYSDKEVEDVLRLIGANKFIDGYKDGINTTLEYLGGNLSTGEKQLISFARILLRDPRIVILDEATANIDTETELLIQNALKVISKNRTTFVIAHRLSTIYNADNIVVFDSGRIVEQGKHNELLLKNGLYKSMYDNQYNKG